MRKNDGAFCLRRSEAPRDRSRVLLSTSKYSRNRPSLDQSESIFRGVRSNSPHDGTVRRSLVNTVRGWFAYAIRVLSGDQSGTVSPGVSTVKGVVPLESMIQMSISFVPVRSTAARRPSGDRATFQGPAGPGSPSVATAPAGRSNHVNWDAWLHPFGTRSFRSPKRKPRHAERPRHGHGFGHRHRITGKLSARRIEPAGDEGSLARKQQPPRRRNRRRVCRRQSAVSFPGNRASRDRSRGHPRFPSRRRGTACRRGETRGPVRGLARAELGDGDRLAARGRHPEQRARQRRVRTGSSRPDPTSRPDRAEPVPPSAPARRRYRFASVPAAKNPTERPSGDQKGRRRSLGAAERLRRVRVERAQVELGLPVSERHEHQAPSVR